MDKNIQYLAWQCLPKEVRDKIRKDIATHLDGDYYKGWQESLINYFGHHNLTSDEEPSELLFVERKKVQELYSDYQRARVTKSTLDKAVFDGRLDMLDDLFDNKCLPDTEPSVQGEPKFKVGDKVRVIDIEEYADEITEIIAVDKSDPIAPYKLDLLDDEGCGIWCDGNAIEPYTEPEIKEDMEEKEMNLSKLLKGCEGETVFLVDEGEKIIDTVTDEEIIFRDKNTIGIIHFEGESLLIQPTGFAYAYPSKEAFLAHPLEARKAWNEWAEERKPKVKLRVSYEIIEGCLHGSSSFPTLEFHTEEEAQQAAEAVRECLAKFHESVAQTK